MLKDFSHFKGNDLTRSEKIQRKVMKLLLESKIPDDKRESSLIWELRHASGVCQFGRLLAQKRNLNIELAEIICILHDVHVIIHGNYDHHAKQGEEIARKILTDSNNFSPAEIKLITQVITQHSDKHIFSDDPYIELVKDADVFDCSLYEKSKGGYKLHKSKELYEATIKRIRMVRKELGLPNLPILRR